MSIDRTDIRHLKPDFKGITMKIIIILCFCLLMISCAQTADYSSGNVQISRITDDQLVKDAVTQKRYLSSLFLSEEAKKELDTILKELMSRHPNWLWTKIENDRVEVGMTKHELLLSWGKPYSTHNRKSYWIYKTVGSKRQISFLKGKIKRIFVTKDFKKNSSSTPLSF
ncbi:MAG: hypothetical protein COB38_06570 [Gammaproteobacteria bacterium]|nr:MAG: hypothetical protein COB38_06570 [Gammaproteobacteria bacterium]